LGIGLFGRVLAAWRARTPAELSTLMRERRVDRQRGRRLTSKIILQNIKILLAFYDYIIYDYNMRTDAQKVNTCSLCKHEWISRVEKPKTCPRCKRYEWESPKEKVDDRTDRND